MEEKIWLAFAAALAVGLPSLATAWAQSRIGAAGAGTLAEKPELTGAIIIMVAIPETMVILGFVLANPLRLEPATVAMAGAALILLLTSIGESAEDQSENVHKSFGEVEWVTIFFFVGLFILVHGLEHVGLLRILAGETDADLGDTHTFLWQVAADNGQIIPDGTTQAFAFTATANATTPASIQPPGPGRRRSVTIRWRVPSAARITRIGRRGTR